jgi:CubicO group peptidase (beta-lactamase class C family)
LISADTFPENLKMKFSISLFGALLIVAGSVHTAIPPGFEEAVRALITEQFLPKNSSPGIGISVVSTDGSLDFSRGYGLKDIANNVSMDDSSLFAMASISKSVCATLVSRTLNEKFPQLGEAALDAPIAQLAPSLNFTFIDRARGESMSFRDLLSHRSCLGTSNFGRTVGAFASTPEYIFRSRYIPEICPFRTGYNYNNAMFSVAGELIAQINGNSNYTEMLGNFLKELGMNNSRPIRKEDDYENLENLSTPYYLQDGKLVRSNPNLIRRASVSLGSGGVITSPADMKKYLSFQLNLGNVNGTQIVPRAVMRWLRKPTNPFNFNGYESGSSKVNGDLAYGLGLNIGFYEGTRMLQHGGFWPPYASQMTLYPDLNLGIFSSSNGPGRLDGYGYLTLHNSIAALFLGTKTIEEAKQDLEDAMNKGKARSKGKSKLKSKVCKQCITVSPEKIPGVYGNPSQGDLQIIVNESDPKGRLRLLYGSWGSAYVRETNDSRLLLEWDSDVVSDFWAAGGPYPNYYLNYLNDDSFYIEDRNYPYTRNATFETLPAIPWAPGSCSHA